jgi:hypothetical protein
VSIRTLTGLAVCLVLTGGIVTANLWRELHAERQSTAALLAELGGSTRHVTVADAPRVETPPPPSAPMPAPAPATPQKEAVKAPATTVALPTAIAGGVRMSEQDLLQDPEFRQARLAMLRTSIAQGYPGIAEELGLTKEEADRLFDLLAESELAMSAELGIITPPSDDASAAAAIAEANRRWRAVQGRQSQALQAMLGDARYAQWRDYQQTRQIRLQASSYATALAGAGAPLDSTQLRTLTTAMVGEHKSMEQDILSLARAVDPANPGTREQAQKALQDRQAASNQRVLDAAASKLNAQQLGLLRAQLEQQEAIKNAAARVRERSEATRSP